MSFLKHTKQLSKSYGQIFLKQENMIQNGPKLGFLAESIKSQKFRSLNLAHVKKYFKSGLFTLVGENVVQ